MYLYFEELKKLFKRVVRFKDYHLYEKWNLFYMTYNLQKQKLKFGDKYHDSIFKASVDDINKIKSDLYPSMIEDYDVRYFKQLGRDGFDCFLCEQAGHFIHYSWIFYDLAKSPLSSTPIGIKRFCERSLFWGPTFTVPNSRGLIYPYVFSKIVLFLRAETNFEHILICAYKGNKGAVKFYKNLGFEELSNPPRPPFWVKLLRILDASLCKYSLLIRYS
tara:strand:- start:276 stop:929 length:654 start_codon:yes stop_codon:yes gene_type:complete